MKRAKVLALLAAHREELAAFGVRRLALFGSVARDAAGPTSDVDLLVEFEGRATFDRYVELSFYLEALLHRSVDLVTIESLRGFMREVIEKDVQDVAGLSPLSR